MIGRGTIRLIAGMVLVGAILGRGETAVAKPACEELAGAVVFYDLLYGLGAGAILGGLYLAATEDGEDAGAKLAGGGLVGATIGAGVGGLELAMRNCDAKPDSPAKDTKESGIFRPKPLVAATPSQNGRSGWALGFSMALR